jgi:hypothetical protein
MIPLLNFLECSLLINLLKDLSMSEQSDGAQSKVQSSNTRQTVAPAPQASYHRTTFERQTDKTDRVCVKGGETLTPALKGPEKVAAILKREGGFQGAGHLCDSLRLSSDSLRLNSKIPTFFPPVLGFEPKALQVLCQLTYAPSPTSTF